MKSYHNSSMHAFSSNENKKIKRHENDIIVDVIYDDEEDIKKDEKNRDSF